ncbi:MAG TPA: helix-turn-helix transcriptional regulator [Nevskiaceae bacterium]|nr:helix-turn-helix transcriptional regulator [Nevskiaceae bacterium]
MEMPASDLPSFGLLLRDCRRARKRSQLDLSVDAEVSQRHLSFLESGRAQPSREMVLQLAQALDLPLRERNRLLMSAGFAGIYPQRKLDAKDMQPVRQALEMLIRHHEPLPAIVVDRGWNLFMANAAVPRLFSLMGDLEEVWKRTCGDGPRNILKLMFHEHGMRPFIRNFADIAPPLLARTAREALEHPQVHEVLEEVLRYPGIPARWRSIDIHAAALPVLPSELHANGVTLRMFSMITTFGTPQDVTTDELRVESFFPADAQSEMLMRKIGAG